MGRIAAVPPVRYWIYKSPSFQRLIVRNKKKIAFQGYLPADCTIRLMMGDTVYQFMHDRWTRFFRIRKARGLPAIHYGKKFGDRWYRIHCHPDKHHLTEV